MKLILFQPEIAANVGASIRNAACFGAEIHIIEPCGFPVKQRDINRVALDYGDQAKPVYHASWASFIESNTRKSGRLILMTTKTNNALHGLELHSDDMFLIGRESSGVPEDVVRECDIAATIPMSPEARSLNMSVTGALALAEARRQTGF